MSCPFQKLFLKVLKERAFHGSTHLIKNQMKLDYVGKGEGVQAYGWGLYLADKRGTANHYMQAGAYSILIDGKPLGGYARFKKMTEDEQFECFDVISAHLYHENSTDAIKKDVFRFASRPYAEEFWRSLYIIVRDAKRISRKPGYVYSVQVDVSPRQLLEWEAFISDQPIANNIEKMLADPVVEEWVERRKGMNNSGATNLLALEGEVFYKSLSSFLGNQKSASLLLLKYGVKGIRYLDGDSRGNTGNRTHNYVIFDDSLITLNSGTSDPNQELMDF